MKTYLGRMDEDEVLPCRMIKLGVVSQVLADMSNVAHYFLEFEGEDLSLALLFEDGERVAFSTAGLDGGFSGMEEETIGECFTQARMAAQADLIPILRQAANQAENEASPLEHRFYTSLSLFVAGGLPNLVQVEAGEPSFSTTVYTFRLNGKKITRVVKFQEIPEDQSQWPTMFKHVQQVLVRKAVALAGGDN